jgi:hypothetical protein
MKLFCTTFRSSILKACALLGFIAAAPLAGAIPAHAQTPNQLLYLYSGISDNGGSAHLGTASVIHCSNFSGADAAIQFVVFNRDGTLKANITALMENSGTITAGTHTTAVYFIDVPLFTGPISQGFAVVVGSSPYFVCTAEVVDAAALNPIGIARHGIRYTPIPGTQE